MRLVDAGIQKPDLDPLRHWRRRPAHSTPAPVHQLRGAFNDGLNRRMGLTAAIRDALQFLQPLAGAITKTAFTKVTSNR